MTTTIPSHAQYVIIGAGIHGLSTAMHLAQRLKARGKSVGPSAGSVANAVASSAAEE